MPTESWRRNEHTGLRPCSKLFSRSRWTRRNQLQQSVLIRVLFRSSTGLGPQLTLTRIVVSKLTTGCSGRRRLSAPVPSLRSAPLNRAVSQTATMPNGHHGTEEEWKRLEAPLRDI